jgi:calcium-dependent protein kinase
MGCCSSNQVGEIQSQKNSNSNISTSRASRVSNGSFILGSVSKQTDYKKKYEYISTIGNGAFGKVRLYRDRKIKSLKYAIKTIKKDIFNVHSIESIIREIEILRSLDHPNIVKYFETYEDEVFLHIVMEYIPGDNLFKTITNKKYVHLTEKDINDIMTCLLKALSFLHHNGIVHRDIKPENILFSVPGNYSSLKLIDFGLSIQKNAKNEKYRVGTPYYMAPEMIKGKYYYESDMWSVGVILYIMVTGHRPFNGKTKSEVFNNIMEGKYDEKRLKKQGCSAECKDLIKKIFIIEHQKRISIENALNHDWFKIFKNNNVNNVIDHDIIAALKNFQSQNLLQKETLYYFAKICSDQEVTKLQQAFSYIDKDNSGEIEYDEIPKIFHDLGYEASEEELKKIFDSLDFHSDGKINYSEFLAATLSSVNFAKEEKLRSAFRYFDTNDNGYINFESVIEALKQNNVVIDEDKLKDVFCKYEKKGINFEEFKKIFYSNSNYKTNKN